MLNTAQIDSNGLRKATLVVLLVVLMVFFGIQAAYIAPSHTGGDLLSNSTLDANMLDTIEDSIPEISPFCYWMCSMTR